MSTATSMSGAPSPLRVVVVEDEPLYRDLLVTGLISRLSDVEVVADFSTGERALEGLQGVDFDVLLTDVDLGAGIDGTQVGVSLRRRRPGIGIVLLSNLAMPSLLAGLPEDVSGGWSYLLKTSVADLDQLALALRESSLGGLVIDTALTKSLVRREASPLAILTPRQMDVLARMANGWSNRRIADDLFLSVRTVESAVSSIIAALGVPNDEGGYNARVTCVLLYLRHTVSVSARDRVSQ